MFNFMKKRKQNNVAPKPSTNSARRTSTMNRFSDSHIQSSILQNTYMDDAPTSMKHSSFGSHDHGSGHSGHSSNDSSWSNDSSSPSSFD